MKISFYGAARSVTGSRHLIEAAGNRILLDCGMYQGRRKESDRLNRRLGFDAQRINAVLLYSCPHFQKNDATYMNKKERRRGTQRLSLHYNEKDVRAIIQRFSSIRYGKIIRVSPRIKVEFYDAGHILGSSSIWLKHTHQGNSGSVLFSGDLGKADMPIVRDPQAPPSCDTLILE